MTIINTRALPGDPSVCVTPGARIALEGLSMPGRGGSGRAARNFWRLAGHDEGVEHFGQRVRLEGLYAQCAAAVMRYARSRVESREAAEDVVMEVFVIACRRLEAIPAGGELPWLLACARRVLANQRRGERRARALSERLRESAQFAEVEPAEGDVILAALEQVSERDREVLLLSVWEELSPQELGVALGCSRATAAVRLHRARRRFAAAYSRVQTGAVLDPRTEVTG
jgi:RNA polymerase sigma-70 factor (ECF subfamily)